LPEVDRGALGAATHLARMVPQHRLRHLVYTASLITADEMARYGSVLAVVGRDDLVATAREVAARSAAKAPAGIRMARAGVKGSDRVDVKRSYRFEQGFTFELNLTGVSDELRDDFVRGPERPGGEAAQSGDSGDDG